MKMKLLLMLLAIALMAGVAGANMLTNPGFEEGAFGSADTPDGWAHYWTGYSAQHVWISSAAGAHSGDKFMKMYNWLPYGDSSDAFLGQVVEVQGGGEYSFEVWAKNAVAGSPKTAMMSVEWYSTSSILTSSAAGYISSAYTSAAAGDDWGSISFSDIAPADAIVGYFWLVAPLVNDSNSICYDDASMVGPDPNFVVDAGVDMITWSGEPVQLDPEITKCVDEPGPLTYHWSSDPNAYFSDPDALAPTATIIYDPSANLGGGGGGEVTILDPTPITVPNQGFEDRVMPDGNYGWWRTTYNPNSWRYADHNNDYPGEQSVSYFFQWNPGFDVPPGTNWRDNGYGGEAPEGDNVIAVDNSIGGCAQILAETFDHNKAYQLTAKVANSDAWGWWEGYGLEILVGGTNNNTNTSGYWTVNGGTRIAYVEKTEEQCGFEDETFYTVSLTYLPNEADAGFDGDPLQIRVMSHSDDGYAIFDDVTLVSGTEWTVTGGGGDPNYNTVTLTLQVSDESLTRKDTMTIDVYETQCGASIAAGATPLDADRDGDCIVNLGDFAEIAAEWLDGSDLAELAEMAEEWLEDINIDGPAEKP